MLLLLGLEFLDVPDKQYRLLIWVEASLFLDTQYIHDVSGRVLEIAMSMSQGKPRAV